MSQPRANFEQVNGSRLAYRHWTGPADGQHPPVVLLHGVLQAGEGMRHLARSSCRSTVRCSFPIYGAGG